MSMVTQCPHCTTAFNVTPEQLFARDGRVRCGHCNQVFDGLVNLTSLEALQAGVPPPLAEASDAVQHALADSHDSATRPTITHGFTPLNWPMLPDVPVVPVPMLPENNADTAQALAVPRDKVLLLQHSGDDETVAEPQPHKARWPWAIAAVFALVTLFGQGLHAFRSDLAAHYPGMKPALVQLCVLARCTVSPLQRPTALNIQASDLLILDKAKPQFVQLIVTMQNQSALDVGYPAIDLVLNDRFDHAVARRVFLPADYLRGVDAQKTVIAASVTTTVRIDLDVSELSAGGFGLLLIPAPQS
jgi:predicted Zn finger-like uncharacterized protein